MLHTTHPEIVNRLKRAEGHLRSIVEMIENGRACTDIAQQLHAVEKAVANAKRALIHDHIDHCLDAATNGGGWNRGWNPPAEMANSAPPLHLSNIPMSPVTEKPAIRDACARSIAVFDSRL